MTFRVMSIRTMDHAGQVVLQLRHGGTMSPYACDRDEGKLHRPNWGLDAAESGGSSRARNRSRRPAAGQTGRNESTRCASTPDRPVLWLRLVCRLRGALEGDFSTDRPCPEPAERAKDCPPLGKQ